MSTNKLIYIVPIPGGPMKILLQDHYFQYEDKTLKVPAGFAFDGPSIPRYLSFVYKPNDNDILRFSLEHDFLYSTICLEDIRRDADRHYVKYIKPYRTKIFSHIGVRIGGRRGYKQDINYRKYKKEIIEARERLGINFIK